MASESFVQSAILRFDGHYDHWSMLIENFLRSKEYWNVFESRVVELALGTVMTEVQWTKLEGLKLKDLKALPLPSNWSFYLEKYSQQRNFQADFGFHEEEIQEVSKSKKATASTTSYKVWNTPYEV